MATVTCTECKKQTEVPFEPTAGKPVYCNECFRKKRAERPAGGPGGRGGRGGPRHAAPERKSFSRADYPGFERFKSS